MPELTRLQREGRRYEWVTFQRKQLDELTDGAKSELIPHDLDPEMKIDKLIEKCFFCGQEQDYKAKDLTDKYCKQNSISLAKNKGTFNPDYKGVGQS